MVAGKKLTELDVEVKNNLSNDGTLVYVVNNNESKQVDLANLLFDGIVTSNTIASNAITADKITAATIDAIKISAAEINVNSIVAQVISSLEIFGNQIVGNSITADQIAGNTITAAQIAANTITAAQIAAGTITAAQIAAGTITTDILASNSVTTDTLAANSVTTDTLAANSVTTDTLAANSITANEIAANSITTDTLAANSITTDTLAANAITAAKISNGTIASESMIASNIITAQSISSNAIITGSIQSKNFDGSYNADTGLIGAGTEGFYLEGNTGTIIANTLVARDDIITGNMIKFSDGKALQANPETGELEVVVDDDTLSIQDGKLAIKTIPSTAVYSPIGDITYSGAIIEKEIGTYSRGNGNIIDAIISSGSIVSPFAGSSSVTTNAAASIFTIDLLDHVTAPGAVTGATLYNLTFEVDYTNIVNLANIDGLCRLGLITVPSDSLTDFINVGSTTPTRFFQIQNPTFPVAKVDYTLNSINIKPGTLQPTNRYLHVFPYFSYSKGGPDYNPFDADDTIAIKIKASTDMRLTINATGTLTNTNRSMQDLLDVTPANDYWVDGQGFNYDDSVFN